MMHYCCQCWEELLDIFINFIGHVLVLLFIFFIIMGEIAVFYVVSLCTSGFSTSCARETTHENTKKNDSKADTCPMKYITTSKNSSQYWQQWYIIWFISHNCKLYAQNQRHTLIWYYTEIMKSAQSKHLKRQRNLSIFSLFWHMISLWREEILVDLSYFLVTMVTHTWLFGLWVSGFILFW